MNEESSHTLAAQPLPLSDVVIKGDNRLTNNRDLAIKTILSWDVEQQLYNYRDTYGLPTEGYPKADGWDSPTTKLKGHGSGHYMSALAFAYAYLREKKGAIRMTVSHTSRERTGRLEHGSNGRMTQKREKMKVRKHEREWH